MSIQPVTLLNPISSVKSVDQQTKISPAKAHQSFSGFLNDAINEVNRTQVQSDQLTEKLALGENVELHQVLIAAEKASITLQTAVEVRNKVIEAYQEIMRMQV